MSTVFKKIIAAIAISSMSLLANAVETRYFNSEFDAINFCFDHNCLSIDVIRLSLVRVTYDGAMESPGDKAPPEDSTFPPIRENGIRVSTGLSFFDSKEDVEQFCIDNDCIPDCSTNECMDYLAFENYSPNPPYQYNLITLYIARSNLSASVVLKDYVSADGPMSLRQVVNTCYASSAAHCVSIYGASGVHYLTHGKKPHIPSPLPQPVKPGEGEEEEPDEEFDEI